MWGRVMTNVVEGSGGGGNVSGAMGTTAWPSCACAQVDRTGKRAAAFTTDDRTVDFCRGNSVPTLFSRGAKESAVNVSRGAKTGAMLVTNTAKTVRNLF